MNIFHKFTLENLKRNRARTTVTIVGAILSAALITAVTTFISSYRNYMIQSAVAGDGAWHVRFSGSGAELPGLLAAGEAESVAVTQNIGHAAFENSASLRKPYLGLTAYDEKAFELLPPSLVAGRLPENGDEVIVSDLIEDKDGKKPAVGDLLHLKIGDRMHGGKKLGYSRGYVLDREDGVPLETLVPHTEKTFKVVGICRKPWFERSDMPGRTIITRTDGGAYADGKGMNFYIRLKDPSAAYTFGEAYASHPNFLYNDSLLRSIGASPDKSSGLVMVCLGGLLILLIAFGSVLLIYNAFSISVSERTRQFGILASAGATGRQLWKSVLFEAAAVGIIAIPVGVAAGIAGIGALFAAFGGVLKQMTLSSIRIGLSVSVVSVAAAAAVGVLTILLSALIPALRAARLSPMDAIRQRADIKFKPKYVKTSKPVEALFGAGGVLALKNFKRNKKRARSTTVSLFVSVVLFVSANGFTAHFRQNVSTSNDAPAYDLSVGLQYVTENDMFEMQERLTKLETVSRSSYYVSEYFTTCLPAGMLSDRSRQTRYSDAPPDFPLDIQSAVCFIEDRSYDAYIKKLGLDPRKYSGENLNETVGMAKRVYYNEKTRRYERFDLLRDRNPLKVTLERQYTNDTPEQPRSDPAFKKEITVSHFADEFPGFSSGVEDFTILIFLPYSARGRVIAEEPYRPEPHFQIYSENPGAAEKEIQEILKEGPFSWGYVWNDAAAARKTGNMVWMINVFVNIFIVMISLIVVANLFNTVSTNMGLRKREFAMLKSVGMSDRKFNAMLRFESVFYGVKALLYGLPAAYLVTYLSYRIVLIGSDIAFVFPWRSTVAGVFGVFFITFITMAYSLRKVRKENVADALRSEIL